MRTVAVVRLFALFLAVGPAVFAAPLGTPAMPITPPSHDQMSSVTNDISEDRNTPQEEMQANRDPVKANEQGVSLTPNVNKPATPQPPLRFCLIASGQTQGQTIQTPSGPKTANARGQVFGNCDDNDTNTDPNLFNPAGSVHLSRPDGSVANMDTPAPFGMDAPFSSDDPQATGTLNEVLCILAGFQVGETVETSAGPRVADALGQVLGDCPDSDDSNFFGTGAIHLSQIGDDSPIASPDDGNSSDSSPFTPGNTHLSQPGDDSTPSNDESPGPSNGDDSVPNDDGAATPSTEDGPPASSENSNPGDGQGSTEESRPSSPPADNQQQQAPPPPESDNQQPQTPQQDSPPPSSSPPASNEPPKSESDSSTDSSTQQEDAPRPSNEETGNDQQEMDSPASTESNSDDNNAPFPPSGSSIHLSDAPFSFNDLVAAISSQIPAKPSPEVEASVRVGDDSPSAEDC